MLFNSVFQTAILERITILNAAESKITTISVLTDQDADRRESTDPNQPTINYDPNLENVGTVSIRISKTSDNSVPRRVQLGIFGCATPSTPGSKPQLQTTTPRSTVPMNTGTTSSGTATQPATTTTHPQTATSTKPTSNDTHTVT